MSSGARAPRRRSGRALLVSLAVHGVLLLALLRRAPPPPPAAAPPLEVEIREPPAPEPPPRERHASTEPKTVAEPSPVSPRPAPTSPAAPDEGSSLLRMRAPNLALDPATVDRFARDGIITAPAAPTAPQGGTAHPGKSKWQEKLALLEREDAGRKNVAEGKVHPEIFDYLRDAEKSFAPRESVVEKDPRAPNTVGRTVHQWTHGFVRNYLDLLKQLDRDEPRRKSPLAEHGATDVLAGYDRLLRAAEKGAEAIACQVCLVIRPGLPPEVVLAKSSGNTEIDHAATDALMRASLRRPMENDLRPQRACYRFAATIQRIPPMPMVGCGFDESTLASRLLGSHHDPRQPGIGCYYPGMQAYQLKVSLDSVDYSGG